MYLLKICSILPMRFLQMTEPRGKVMKHTVAEIKIVAPSPPPFIFIILLSWNILLLHDFIAPDKDKVHNTHQVIRVMILSSGPT